VAARMPAECRRRNAARAAPPGGPIEGGPQRTHAPVAAAAIAMPKSGGRPSLHPVAGHPKKATALKTAGLRVVFAQTC